MTLIIEDIMITKLITFQPNQNIHQAIQVLLDKRISGAPVVDDSGKMIGILSRKDCLKTALNARYHDDWGGLVEDFMQSDVKTLDASLDITSAVQKFIDTSFHRFPVMRDGQLVGLISRLDILTALSKN